MNHDLNQQECWLEAAKETVLAAGRMIKQARVVEVEVAHKGELDLVTEIDVKAEEFIINELRRRFPEHGVLAEESGGRRSDEYLWVIDPIDGTTNYAHGYPVYAVSIGLFFQGRPVVGAVYDPNLDELFTASADGGAELNGERIYVSEVRELNEALLATGFPYTLRKDHQRIFKDFKNMSLACQGIRRAGAASLDICALACGRLDGFWEVGLKPWDTAAAALVLLEAGGRLTRRDGSPFDHFVPEIVASNGLIHEQMSAVLGKPD